MINSNRLEYALRNLKPSDWERFERLASAFLASEFDQLRTMATPSGDKGRDAELFVSATAPATYLQYSVTENWKAKIRETSRQLRRDNAGASVLIYVTNQRIGALGDTVKKDVRTKDGLTLDIRDLSWFCERVGTSLSCQVAAEELARIIVDPLLSAAGVGPHVHSELSKPEAIAAVVFLGLQWQDDTRAKGLTRLAFEAVVRGVLVETDSQRRMTRAKVHEAVGEILRGHDPKSLKIYTDSAINRLLKSAIRRWPNDEFCLSHAEVTRLGEFKTRSALAEVDLVTAIEEISRVLLTGRALQNAVEIDFARCIRSATDAVLFERSQAFAMAVHKGELAVLAETDFGSTLNSVLSQHSLPKSKEINWISLLKSGVRQILTSDVLAIQSYLRSLADSYTLLAFLRQTPDVQGAVEKMFSHGKLWLDTTIVLPLIADTLESEADSRGRFSRMIEAARSAGLELYATRGVTEEVERHMNKALTCARMQSGFWEGPIPFLLQRYIAAGRSADSFNGWLENFRGEAHPQEDLEDYLENELHIRIRSLESEAQSMSDELRHGLQKILLERYQKREERYGTTLDENAVTRLVSHDIECFAGVLGLRGQRRISPFGYDEWWLTVDRQAYSLCGRLASYVSGRIPESPVMSADFLINYLAFGPLRKKVGKSKESRLPVLMTHSASHLTPELLEEARILRERYRELPERVIQRTVRDQLNRARAQVGPIANMGMDDDDEFLR